jgi:hypothetical protein
LIPEHDEFLSPAQARARFKHLAKAQLIEVAGAKHLWTGEPYVRRVLDELVQVVAPNRAPLPHAWSGPMTKWNDI